MKEAPEVTLSVLIPTYRRPEDLDRCLNAIVSQQEQPNQVVVVLREDDEPSRSTIEKWSAALPITTVTVGVPGQVHALNSGLLAATGDIVCITDDDAAPRPDWLKRIKEHFEHDSSLGGVGGRDWVHFGDRLIDDEERDVGRLAWYGRVIGNHHLGSGMARSADVLKGANMSFRSDAINELRFDARLLGQGAQVHNDLGFCLEVRRRGWRLLYDPAVAVDHYPARRHDNDQRGRFDDEALYNATYNLTLVLVGYLSPFRAAVYLLWSALRGSRAEPGVLACIYLWLIAHDGEAPKKTAICWRARRDAVRSFLRQRRGRVRPVSSP